MTLDTFTDPSPITVGQPTKRSDVNKVYANTFFLREMVEPWVTGGETISVGEVCYLAETTDGGATIGRVYKTDADNIYSCTAPTIIGICTVAMTSGSTGRMRRVGLVEGLSGITVGALHFVSATPGALTTTEPAISATIGIGLTTTSILLCGESATWINSILRTSLRGAPTGTGAIVLANAPAFTAVPTFTPGAGATPATVSGVVYVNTTSTDSTNAGLQSLITETLDANTLNANGKAVRVTIWGTSAFNANAKSVGLTFGGSVSAGWISIPANYQYWHVQGVIVRTGASTQVATGVGTASNNAGAGATAALSSVDFGTPAADTTAAINISASCNTSVAADVVLKGFMIEVLN